MAFLTSTHLLVLMVSAMMTLCTVRSFPFGAPNYVCSSMTPSHLGRGQVYSPDTFPFVIQLSTDTAMPGDIVLVSVSVRNPGDKFQGFLSTVLDRDSHHVGGFITTPTDNLKLLNCTSSGKSVLESGITHSRRLNTSSSTFGWRVPMDAVIGSRYNIRLTIVLRTDLYWIGLNNTLTVGQPARTNKPLITSTNPGSTSTGAGTTLSGIGSASSGIGSASSGIGSAPLVPATTEDSGAAGSLDSNFAAQARPSTTSELQHPSESNLVDGSMSLSASNRPASGRGRGNARRGSQNARMSAWLTGWFGR